MSKRNPPEPENRRKKQPANTASSRSPGATSVLLLWPFHLFSLFTRPLGQPFRFLARAAGYPLVACLYALLVLAIIYGIRAQRYDLGKIHEMPERSIIHDRLGEEIGRIHGEKRSLVPLRDVSPFFRKAILAREDDRFYKHGGFDPFGIIRALTKNAQGKRQGASTLTQQLVSDIFQLKYGETRGDIVHQLDRKFLEIALAIRLETSVGKDEILEAYINQINWGHQIKGIGEAARIYFEKHPSELDLSQSAMLAGIVRGPDAFNPFRSLEAATRERDTTLERMVTTNAITRAEADDAKQQPIKVRPPWRREARESYAMDAIRADLEIILEKQDIDLGGLDITTTIDLRVQQKAEESLDRRLHDIERLPGYAHPTRDAWRKIPEDERGESAYLQGAVVVLENRTGAVLAVVGGRDANESRFNRATDGQRQLGSIFKPFVYLAAFDKGLRPDSMISDGPIEPGEIKGAGNWRPHNSDGKFGGMEPISYGLIHSRNTMSVRVGNHAGLPKVKDVALNAGFTTAIPNKPSAYLGAWEASPWEVASAYSIFPNAGQRYRPYLISEIRDRANNVLYSAAPLPYQAAGASSAVAVSHILTEVTTTGTAAAVQLSGFKKPCAGKTGTTNEFKDAWFAGYTATLTCAVWSGFDIPKQTMHGGYGAVIALPVWIDIIKTADNLGYKAGALHSKANLVTENLCRLSGKRATANCKSAGTTYTDKVPADIALPDNDFCPIHPARAIVVANIDTNTNTNNTRPLRALPVEEPPLRALPVDEPILRAEPVDEPGDQ